MTSNASPEVPNPYAAPATASIEGSEGPATFVSRGVASVLVGRLLKSVWVLSAVTILVTIADYLLDEWRYSELARVGSVDHIPAAWLQLSEVFGWLQIAIVPRCWLALILATTATIIAWHVRMFWNLRALEQYGHEIRRDVESRLVVLPAADWIRPGDLCSLATTATQ